MLIFNNSFSQGKIYFVYGSDTATWDGMNTGKYNCYYGLSIFTADNTNTVTVMSDEFRNNIKDWYGNPLKFTWWMMAGNIYRFATNTNVPLANTMTLHAMKEKFGTQIAKWGDELSLHYHTFAWTDYNNDGKYWWNQAHSFMECKDDFDVTMAQYLLEENTYPVSFRSGWHYMDNEWQHYLNKLIPFGLHNDYPAKRTTDEEPIDNVYDWSLASSKFVPFHPLDENYQLIGNGKGWNVRCKYLGSTNTSLITEIFNKAAQGNEDQVVCLWSHLPGETFISEIENVNAIIHQVAANYPYVQYKYCTAVEAYQLWLKNNDTTKPELGINWIDDGGNLILGIESNEDLFQEKPFVAYKDKNENYYVCDGENIGTNNWFFNFPVNVSELGKVGIAAIDNSGNLTTHFLNYLPDDLFIDNNDNGYYEAYGNWSNSSKTSWGKDSRIATLNPNDSAKVSFSFEYNAISDQMNNLFLQFPQVDNQIDTVTVSLLNNGNRLLTKIINIKDKSNKWVYLFTNKLENNKSYSVEIKVVNKSSSIRYFNADVLKRTAYVRERQINITTKFLNPSPISEEDSLDVSINIDNFGYSDLTIQNIYSIDNKLKVLTELPLVINGMQSNKITFRYYAVNIGSDSDTLVIKSNDLLNSIIKIPFTIAIEKYFSLVDNEQTEFYNEYGDWKPSVAQSYGGSSRYAYIQNTSNGPYAVFKFNLKKDGIYDLYEILPVTVNAANNALYKVIYDGRTIDSLYLNQNEGSGSWKNVGRYTLYKNKEILVKVIDDGKSTQGPVIRTDAFKLSLFSEITSVCEEEYAAPKDFALFQNYPNPFNPETTIKFQLPEPCNVKIVVYNIMGEEIETLLNENKQAGIYQLKFNGNLKNGSQLSSGIYFYKLETNKCSQIMKMILLK